LNRRGVEKKILHNDVGREGRPKGIAGEAKMVFVLVLVGGGGQFIAKLGMQGVTKNFPSKVSGQANID